jgi:hypothetical protein
MPSWTFSQKTSFANSPPAWRFLGFCFFLWVLQAIYDYRSFSSYSYYILFLLIDFCVVQIKFWVVILTDNLEVFLSKRSWFFFYFVCYSFAFILFIECKLAWWFVMLVFGNFHSFVREAFIRINLLETRFELFLYSY